MKIKKEKFECKRGELTIKGYILKSEQEKKQPCVIVSHGFSSNIQMTKKYASFFAKKGYVAVYFDFCGSGVGKSDGRSQDMSVLTQKEDLSAVLDYVQTLEYVDTQKMILAGCSQGGFVSALLAAERETEIAKIILYYPALCIPDDARRGKMLGKQFDPDNVPASQKIILVNVGEKYVADAQALDPYQEICVYRNPVLIVHGTKDKMVPISYSEKAQEIYPNAKLVKIKNGDHGFFICGFKESMREAIHFLRES